VSCGRGRISAGARVVTYTVDAENAEDLWRRVKEYLVPAARELKGIVGSCCSIRAKVSGSRS
jgi:hypothetical protein